MTHSLQAHIERAFKQAEQALARFSSDTGHSEQMAMLAVQLAKSFQSGQKILICGNGGSACDAMHFAEELTGRYRQNRRALPVIALADASHITCVGNDFGFAEIFARGVEAYGMPGDWLIVMSTSGHSANIIRAVEQAKQQQLKTVALLGKDGGKLKGQCDFEFIIRELTSDRIQEIHMLILHILVEGIERELFPELYPA